MKFNIVLVLSIALFSACGPAEKENTGTDSLASSPTPADQVKQVPPKIDSDSIKKVPVPAEPTGTGKEVIVNEGIVYCTIPYCGGARPTEEIVEQRKKAILLTNSTLKLRNKAGTDYIVVTNDKGIFRSGIPAGQYDVYLTKDTNKKIWNVSPETCADCLTKPMSNVIIQKGIQASFVIPFNCGPNDKWRP